MRETDTLLLLAVLDPLGDGSFTGFAGVGAVVMTVVITVYDKLRAAKRAQDILDRQARDFDEQHRQIEEHRRRIDTLLEDRYHLEVRCHTLVGERNEARAEVQRLAHRLRAMEARYGPYRRGPVAPPGPGPTPELPDPTPAREETDATDALGPAD